MVITTGGGGWGGDGQEHQALDRYLASLGRGDTEPTKWLVREQRNRSDLF